MEKKYTGIATQSKSLEHITNIPYKSLVELRDSGKLVPGKQYRIIDYNTTTYQPNTASAMHPFDIIVTADTENTLSETARACISQRDNGYFSKFTQEVIVGDAYFKDGITHTDIETVYFIGIDNPTYDFIEDNENGEANVGKDDFICEIGYEENNEGVEVPVFYKNDPNFVDEGTDYEDKYFYVGQEEVDGELFDKWRKIDNSMGWDDTTQVYILTNQVVEAEVIYGDKVYVNVPLEAWEIKYCLDNDYERFAWANKHQSIYTDDDCWLWLVGNFEYNGKSYYKWQNKEDDIMGDYILLSETLNLSGGDSIHAYDTANDIFEEYYSTVIRTQPAGTGVIYYMKDEHGNECGYDFKNILINNANSHSYWRYTFCDGYVDASLSDECYNNVIKNSIQIHSKYKEQFIIPLNTFRTPVYNNTILENSYDNVFESNANANVIGKDFMYNTIDINFVGNNLGNVIKYCSFGKFIAYTVFDSNIHDLGFPDNYKTNMYKTDFVTTDIVNGKYTYDLKFATTIGTDVLSTLPRGTNVILGTSLRIIHAQKTNQPLTLLI